MSLNSQNSICISIEGNIGSGKSTLLKILSRKDDIDVIKEPVISWQKIGGNPKNNLLEAFYQDPHRWCFTFQTYAYFTRIKQWSQLKVEKPYIISERSIYSDKNIFAENGRKSGFINELEWKLYEQNFNWIVNSTGMQKLNGIVYLQTDPTICYERLQKRGRQEEKDTIEFNYLKSIHDRHDEWLVDKGNDTPVLAISGNREFEKDLPRQREILNEILAWMEDLQKQQ